MNILGIIPALDDVAGRLDWARYDETTAEQCAAVTRAARLIREAALLVARAADETAESA